MRDYESLTITQGESTLYLSASKVFYKGVSGDFELQGEFPFWKTGMGLATHRRDIWDYKGESSIRFTFDILFDNGDREHQEYVGTLFQNAIVFILNPFREALKELGHEIPFEFLQEYAPGEEIVYAAEKLSFLVCDKRYGGRYYHFEGDLFDKTRTKIYDCTENEDGIEISEPLFSEIFARYHASMYESFTHLPRAKSFLLKVNKRKRRITRRNVFELLPQIIEDYHLPDMVFGYYPSASGEGYHVSARSDGYRGTFYLSCASNIDKERAFATVCMLALSTILKRKKNKPYDEGGFHLSPYEYLGARGKLKDALALFEPYLDTHDCLSFVDSISVAEIAAEKAGFDDDTMFQARDYLIRLERPGYLKMKALKKLMEQ